MPRNPRDTFTRIQRDHRLGEGPVESRIASDMLKGVRGLDMLLNGQKLGEDRTWGFVLLVFPFGDRSWRCNFASNGADRRDVANLMREMIGKFEADEPSVSDPPPGFDAMPDADPDTEDTARLRNAKAPEGPGNTLAARWAFLGGEMLPPDLPKGLREVMRRVFYLGANELFALMLDRLESGVEPTENDLEFMNRIRGEMDRVLSGQS